MVVTDNTAQVGNWIDRSGFDSLSFAIQTGTIVTSGANFTVLMEEANAATNPTLGQSQTATAQSG